MRTTKTLKASTTHDWEKYAFTEEEFIASYNEYDNNWSISHPVLGCSKGRDTPEEALRNVLYEHGCTNIVLIDEDEPATTEISTTEKRNKTMNVQEINKALIRFSKAGKVHAEEKVNTVYLPLAEKLAFWTAQKGADKVWPKGSLLKSDINNSQDLQDIFVRLTPPEISEHVRDCKFVFENYDAIQDYVAENGWASMGHIRKKLTEKAKADPEAGEDTGEDTGENAGEEGVPLVKDVAYFADKLASLIAEAKSEGIVFKDVIGYTKQMANVA
jgi:hypothetical protein